MPRPKSTIPLERTEVRLPATIKERIRQLAAQENRSFNAQMIELLKDALNRARIKRES